ncbi:hypothetical protein HPB51_002067 [Rhipicephalus microplus]|uniref:Uncharacterized protein n=1 Tax=Rhipicephalus microplus TaxID=6941 RepID=A0A9J6E5Q2_RHIMP|nr:hypothetical protein HPB51_002067 [Rhipicephalus microplus]
MDLQQQSYTVFGFSKELDWRPLNFVDLIPAERICNGCGLLAIETAHLPCRHVLCKPCFQQCLVNEEYECLLGCNQFTKKDVEWRAFPMKDLLEYKVAITHRYLRYRAYRYLYLRRSGVHVIDAFRQCSC